MKNRFHYGWTFLIFAFCWTLLATAEDEATIPAISAPEAPNTDKDSDSVGAEPAEVENLEPSVDSSFSEQNGDTGADFKGLFAEATSQNSGVANDIISSGPPVMVTLSDLAATELHQRAIISDHSEPPGPMNDSLPGLSPLGHPETKENLTEEIPSFSEWAQKRLEEAEKNKEPQNASTQPIHTSEKQGSGAKLRWKNYASLDCGAKVVAANAEAVSPGAMLSPSRDEYTLNTCTSRMWFIVELCEAIQAKKIDFASFELFSSSPKDFTVSVSDRFPTREWSNVGQFTAKDERDVQNFDLYPHLFGKYIKVEVKSHYGSEHYCPISLFRVYGTSEFEVLEKEDGIGTHGDRDDDYDDDESLDVEKGDATKNVFSSATDAVISIVKKAAQVLGNKGNVSNHSQGRDGRHTKYSPLVRICTSPSHLVVCDNCSDTVFGQIYELLSCHSIQIGNLVHIQPIRRALVNSNACQRFGFDFARNALSPNSNYIQSFFPERFLGAMCNTIAILENKVVLNISQQYSNETQPITEESFVHIEPEAERTLPIETVKETEIHEEVLETPVVETVTSQIKPTKTLAAEDVLVSSTENSVVLEIQTESLENLQEKNEIEFGEVNDSLLADGGENMDVLEENFDGLMGELNGDGQGSQATTNPTPQVQKESVFLRLSNRIKALERNMSLSSQYLEELSKRYKKQVDDMQKLMDKTILTITEEGRKKDEHYQQLEERLISLTITVDSLIAQKNSWSSTIYCIIIASLVTLFIITFCQKPSEQIAIAPKVGEIQRRRKSIDVIQHSAPQKKKRRPSDQALKIVRSSMENNENHARKRRKKRQILRRASSIEGLVMDKVVCENWVRTESAPAGAPTDWVEGKHIEEIPFVLEESEHSSLEPLLLLANEGQMVKIEAPPFLDTATNVRLSRVNGESVVARKSVSVDETSLTGRVRPLNGNTTGADSLSLTPKKEKKGLKNIFRKVF